MLKKIATGAVLAATVWFLSHYYATAQAQPSTVQPNIIVNTPQPVWDPPAAAPSSGGNLVVQSPAVIDTGTWAGQALTWVITTFGSLIGAALTAWIVKLFQKAGIETSDLMRQRLQQIVVNGLNIGAERATKTMAGKGKVEIKNAAVASAVVYAQEHGADVMKALGIDPTSPQAVEAIKARIETAIADKDTPTHPAVEQTAAPVAKPAGG